jgi:S-disulfanyl-L-cysteine oxidoreductase SoxD
MSQRRRRKIRIVVSFVLASAALVSYVHQGAANAAGGFRQQSATERRSVWDGVYTAEQAARGQMQYAYSCGRCHQEELQGDSSKDVPPLNDERFRKYWNGRTLKELFDLTSKTMPADGPGSLRASSYLDLLAFLLQTNQFPAGSSDLDPERLDRIVFSSSEPK